MNTVYRQALPGTDLDYFDARAAVDALQPGAYAQLPYTSRVLAENLVRRCDPAQLNDALRQLIERRQDLDFPWYPARVVCHDILGQTALVDLAGLRDAIAEQGGDGADLGGDLLRELAGGDEDEGAGRVEGRVGRREGLFGGEDGVEDGDAVGERLSAAGAGAGEYVLALERERDRLGVGVSGMGLFYLGRGVGRCQLHIRISLHVLQCRNRKPRASVADQYELTSNSWICT